MGVSTHIMYLQSTICIHLHLSILQLIYLLLQLDFAGMYDSLKKVNCNIVELVAINTLSLLISIWRY